MTLRTAAGGVRTAAVIALVAALAVAGCSGGATASPSAAASTPAASSAAPSASASSAPPSTSASSAPPSTSAAGSPSAAASGNMVNIQGFSFKPASVTVAVGTTITWTNMDNVNHTVTADDGSFDSQPIAAGTTFRQTFKKAGTVNYHCKIHPNMTATVVVK